MQTQKISRNLGRLLRLAALSAVALAPMAATLPADAAPGDGRYGSSRRVYRTIDGVVTNDRNGRNFTMTTRRNNRDNNYRFGNRVRVNLQVREPSGLDEGDLVRVYGYFANNNSSGTFFGTSISILRHDFSDRFDDGDDTRTINGTVVSVSRNDRNLTVRSNNGITYTVHTRSFIPNDIDRGDEVRVTGDFDNRNDRSMTNATVTLMDNNNNNNDTNRVFSGDVTSIDRNARRLDVRADDGTSYIVFSRYTIQSTIDRGDRVRVNGELRNRNDRTVRDATITLLENDNDRNDREFNVDFNGTVTFSNSRDTIRVRRDGNNREYVVRTNDAEDYERGDNIRVQGQMTNGVVFASDIDKR